VNLVVNNIYTNPTTLVQYLLIDTTTASVNGGSPTGAVTIPSTVIGRSVISVESSAFQNNTNITALSLPNTVETIGSSAFAACTSLTTAHYGDNTTTLGASMFQNCTSLSTVTGNQFITSIPQLMFGGCSSLTSYTIPATVTSIGASAFGSTGLTEIIITAFVATVGANAFESCSQLATVTWEANSVQTEIPESCFSNCSVLNNITLPSSVTTLGNYCFSGCSSLAAIVVPVAVTTIGTYCFQSCTALSSVEWLTLSASVPNSTFAFCTALTSIYLPSTVTTIETFAFRNCAALENLTIFTFVTSIASDAFDGCTILTTDPSPSPLVATLTTNAVAGDYIYDFFQPPNFYVTIENSVVVEDGVTYELVGNTASVIDGSSATGSVTIPASITVAGAEFPVTIIGNIAFFNLTLITEISLPSSLLSIGTSAFEGCEISALTIPSAVTSIGNRALANCQSLESVTWNTEYSTIPDECFFNCILLFEFLFPMPTRSIVPSTITSIGASAFENTGFTSFTVPATVTFVGNRAFANCAVLTSVVWQSVYNTIPDECFMDCIAITSFHFPNTVLFINANAFANCSELDTLVVYKTIQNIDSTAFDNCTLLKTFASSPPYLGYLFTDAVEGEYAYDFFLPAGTNGFYVNFEGPICFNEGTKILSLTNDLTEEYVPIEKLQSGSIVKTYLHGYRKIWFIGKGNFINNPSIYSSCMYKMKKTESNGLIEDLIVTGGHSLLKKSLGEREMSNKKYFGDTNPTIDGLFLHVAADCDEMEQIQNNKIYTYYHFVIENDGDNDKRYGVYANGVLTETPSFNQFMMQNLKPL
jgi:hypothetical protein